MSPAKKNRGFECRKRVSHCRNSYSQGLSFAHILTKTCIYGSTVIHLEKIKGEEGLTLPIEKEWFANLGTPSDIGL